MIDNALISDIASIWQNARRKALNQASQLMIEAYWRIGCRIATEELKGAQRAIYGASQLKELAFRLTQELDKAFDERELRRIRQFYHLFPAVDEIRAELPWTHYRLLIRIEDPAARRYYMAEAADHTWTSRQLERNIQSGMYQRLIAHKQPATERKNLTISPQPIGMLLKDPYILEFLGASMPTTYSENDLETAIIDNLRSFLLEMGKGFAFVSRQHHIKTDTKSFYVDLVFYNYILKCFVLIDLKTRELSHKDIGQLDMYVRMFDDLNCKDGDNPTVGIILCADKDDTLVRYSVLEGSNQLFASRYMLILPSVEELTLHVETTKQRIIKDTL